MNRRNGTTRITLFGHSHSDSFKCLVDPVSLINSVLGSGCSDDPLELECALRGLKNAPVIYINLKAPISDVYLSNDGSELTIDPYKLTACKDSSAALKALMLLCNDRVGDLPDDEEELDEEINMPALSELALQFRNMDIQVTIHFIS